VFAVKAQELFPNRPKLNGSGNGRLVGIAVRIVTRRRRTDNNSEVLA
jgi:hypothetical protein